MLGKLMCIDRIYTVFRFKKKKYVSLKINMVLKKFCSGEKTNNKGRNLNQCIKTMPFGFLIKNRYVIFFCLQMSKSSNCWIGVLRRSLLYRARKNRVSSLCCNFLEHIIQNSVSSFPDVCFATHFGNGKQSVMFFQFVFI